jgi:hypothetical protein
MTAKANTEQLVYELKTLYHGIRSYIRKIQGQYNVNVLLSDHFDEYKSLADRIYHPIKTMDSVYRYMAPIRETLIDVLGDSELMDNVGKRAFAIRKYNSEEEARGIIISAIDYVLDVYQTIGKIVNEIDRKHSVYTKLSVDTIRYQMTADQTIAGKIAQILRSYSLESEENQDIILRVMENNVQINRQEFLDGRSLWRRSSKRRSLSNPLEINTNDKLSSGEAAKLLPSLDDKYSLRKLRDYINELLGDNDSISTKEVELDNDEDFLLLLLSTVRSQDRNSGYGVSPDSGSLDSGGYEIPNMTIIKK